MSVDDEITVMVLHSAVGHILEEKNGYACPRRSADSRYVACNHGGSSVLSFMLSLTERTSGLAMGL